MLRPPPSRIHSADVEPQTLWVLLLIVVLGMMVWYATHRQPDERIVYVPAATPAPPTPKPTPARRLSPDGTFYLLTYLSVKTPTGIAGFEPGCEVTLVEVHEKNGTLVVTDGRYKVEARPAQLTNDLDIAALARNQDERSQQTVTNYLSNERDKFLKLQQQIDAEHASHIDKFNEQMAKSSAIGRTDNPLNEQSQPASSYDRYILRNGGTTYGNQYYGSPYYYLYRRQSPYYSQTYY